MIYRLLLRSIRPLVMTIHDNNEVEIHLSERPLFNPICVQALRSERSVCILFRNTFAMGSWALSRFVNKNRMRFPIRSTNAEYFKSLEDIIRSEQACRLPCGLVEDIKPRLFVLLIELPGFQETVLLRFDERDIPTCCITHRISSLPLFYNRLELSVEGFTAGLQDIKENQLEHGLLDSEHASTGTPATVSPKRYIS